MLSLLPRQFRRTLPRVADGDGCYLIDDTGKRYLDASGGAAVSCLGHSHPRVREAIRTQTDRVAYGHSGYFTSAAAEALAARLVEEAPGELSHALFVGGGSEAVEAAIKLARQYFLEIGEPQRHRIVSRRQSYHGNTLGALSISGHLPRRAPYAPYLFAPEFIAPYYPYREREPGESLDAYGRRTADDLETTLRRIGSGSVAAFFAETVCGATLGAQPATPAYFKRIREICDDHGILLVLDEVMCGMGRTGTMYACTAEGVAPDIVTCAKGLGGGFQPIGAVVANRRIVDALDAGSGQLRHGHTYMAHPVACAAALAVQDAIRQENLLVNVARQGARLMNCLTETFEAHPVLRHHLGEVRGRGLLVAVELVADRADKTPFDPALAVAETIRRTAQEMGLICYPSSGTIDGSRGDHVLLAPPYIASEGVIDEVVDRTCRSIAEVVASARVVPAAQAGI